MDTKTAGGVEPYTPLSPGAVLSGGKRKKLKLVTKKRARRVLRKLGMKFRGGAEDEKVAVPKEDAAAVGETGMGGRRRKTAKKSKKRSLFGMRY
jgi:hypothetical protein